MGKLICFEGLDSSGKSSQVNLIKEHLKELNLSVTHLHFPMYGHNIFSSMIERFLRGEFGNIESVDPYYVANIYAMDRYKYLPYLKEKLEKNDVVILDRYVYSNVAFQGAKFSDDDEKERIKEWIEKFEFEFLNLPIPDLNLFLDVPLSVIEERLQGERSGADRNYLKGQKDVHEQDLDFQKRVRDVYLNIFSNIDFRFQIINTCVHESKRIIILQPQDVFKKYVTKIYECLNMSV